MFTHSAPSIGIAVLLLTKFCYAIPITTPHDASKTYVAYVNSFCSFKVLLPSNERIYSGRSVVSQEDILSMLTGHASSISGGFPNNPVAPSPPLDHSNDLELPVSLSSLNLMSPPQDEEDFDQQMPGTETSTSTRTALSQGRVDADILEEKFRGCSQQLSQKSMEVSEEMYWDQDRSMNLVVGIVILFLIIVLVAETADVVAKWWSPKNTAKSVRFLDVEKCGYENKAERSVSASS